MRFNQARWNCQSHLSNSSVRCLGLGKRDKTSSFFDFHRHVHYCTELTEVFLEEVLSYGLSRHVNCISGLRLLFLRSIWLFVSFFFFLKLLVQEWDRTIAEIIIKSWLFPPKRRYFSSPIRFFGGHRWFGRWTLFFNRRGGREWMISCWLRKNLLSLLSFWPLELNLGLLRLRDVDVSRFDEFSCNFACITSIFRSLWNQRLFWFRLTFECLHLFFLERRFRENK